MPPPPLCWPWRGAQGAAMEDPRPLPIAILLDGVTRVMETQPLARSKGYVAVKAVLPAEVRQGTPVKSLVGAIRNCRPAGPEEEKVVLI